MIFLFPRWDMLVPRVGSSDVEEIAEFVEFHWVAMRGPYPWISNLVCSDIFIAMSSHPLASGFDDQTCGICIAPFFHAWMAIGANTTIELAPTFKIWRTHAEYILIFPINVRLLPPNKNAGRICTKSWNTVTIYRKEV